LFPHASLPEAAACQLTPFIIRKARFQDIIYRSCLYVIFIITIPLYIFFICCLFFVHYFLNPLFLIFHSSFFIPHSSFLIPHFSFIYCISNIRYLISQIPIYSSMLLKLCGAASLSPPNRNRDKQGVWG
jgi:hypothetical protein